MIKQVAEVSGHIVLREHPFHISTGTACQSSLYRPRGKTDPQLKQVNTALCTILHYLVNTERQV